LLLFVFIYFVFQGDCLTFASLEYERIKMKSSEFVSKFKSWYLWKNLIAVAVVVVLLCLGAKFGLDIYTHHGEAIAIPDLKHTQLADAKHILSNLGLEVQVVDTGYKKTLPPDCILEQSPAPGERVKSGHIIYVTINSPHSPTITLPDIIDNCSLREAMAKLTAMGFKLGTPQYIPGEKDWVYGILVKGRHVVAYRRRRDAEVVAFDDAARADGLACGHVIAHNGLEDLRAAFAAAHARLLSVGFCLHWAT